jgi:hypothetical protein
MNENKIHAHSLYKRAMTRKKRVTVGDITKLPEVVKAMLQGHLKQPTFVHTPITRITSCQCRNMEVKTMMYGELYYIVWQFPHTSEHRIFWRVFYTQEGLDNFARQVLETFVTVSTSFSEEVERLIKEEYSFLDENDPAPMNDN